MTRCGCANDTCSCHLAAGDAATVVGTGTKTNPYVISGVTGIAIVHHGTNASVVRPSSPVVYWLGTATPTNAQPYDFWEAANL